MSESKQTSRRTFLKSSTAVAAGGALLGTLDIARTAHAQGGDEIRAVLVGCGGRGTGAAHNLLNVPDNVKLIAVADAFEDNAHNAARSVLEKYPQKADLPEERIFSGLDAYKKAIDLDCQLVVMATPPGFRPVHYHYAISKGKHVFMEKPCCVDAPGFRLLQEANKMADEKGLKVGVGLQRHHEPKYQETIQRLQDGAIGDILFTRVYWNGGGVWTRPRRPDQTEMEYQVRNWYYFVWLCGDHICEQHVHNLDVSNWLMNAHPVEANGMGGRQVRKGKDHGTIYDHFSIEYTYPNGVKMFSQCRHIPDTWNSVSEHAHGVKGTSDIGGGRIEAGDERWRFRGATPNPYDQEHVDLLKAIRNGEKMNEGWFGATSSFTAVLGRMAVYSGDVVKWDEAVEKGPEDYPYGKDLTFQTAPPILPDEDGGFESKVPMPGVYEAYKA